MPQPEVTDDLLTQAISAIAPPTAAGGGGLASLFEGGGADPNLIGTLTALQSSPMLRGEAPKAGAGPIGQISQALMPLLAAPLYRRQAEQQQAAEKVKMLFALAQLGGAQAKMKGEAAKGERQKQILNIIAKASGAEGAEGPAGAAGVAGVGAQPSTGAIAEGGGAPARRGFAMPPGMKATVTPSGASVSLGAIPKENLLDIRKRALAGDPEAQALLDQIMQEKTQLAGMTTAARVAERPKKPLAKGQTDDYTSYLTRVRLLDDTIAALERGEVSDADVIAATTTAGLLSHPVLRDYQANINELGHERYGTAFTRTESRRLNREAPRIEALLLPGGRKNFLDTLRNARHRAVQRFQDRIKIEERSYDIPPYLQNQLAKMTGIDFTVPSTTETGIGISPVGRDRKTGRPLGLGADQKPYMLEGDTWVPYAK